MPVVEEVAAGEWNLHCVTHYRGRLSVQEVCVSIPAQVLLGRGRSPLLRNTGGKICFGSLQWLSSKKPQVLCGRPAMA